MSKPPGNQPPDWDIDPFSRFFADSEYNCRASAVNLAPIFGFLKKVNEAFRRMSDAVENDGNEDLLVPRFLLVRAHSAFLAACKLAMSGQLPESYAILRNVIEQAWYALHIAVNPPTAEIWLRRNDSDMEKKACKFEFTVANVRSTHERLDTATSKEMNKIYEILIDYGAHPNMRGVLTTLSKTEAPGQQKFNVGILFADQMTIAFALRMAAAVGIGALKVCQLIYPERFKITGLDAEVEGLIVELNSVFKRYRRNATP
jgi:hypothetical protein